MTSVEFFLYKLHKALILCVK